MCVQEKSVPGYICRFSAAKYGGMEGLGTAATDIGHDVCAQPEYTEAKPALGQPIQAFRVQKWGPKDRDRRNPHGDKNWAQTHESSSKSWSWWPWRPRRSWGPNWSRGSSQARLSRHTDGPEVSFAPLHRQKDKVTDLGPGLKQNSRQPQ